VVRRLALVSLLLLAALTVYGLAHERLFQEPLWTLDGRARFLLFAVLYWPVALLLPPRWLGPAAAAFVVGYSIWWCGIAAPLAVLFIFGSAFLVGRILWPRADSPTSAVAGIAILISCVWIALHFPVNRRSIYIAVLAVPWLFEWKRLRGYASSFRFACIGRKQSAALALLLFVLMAHWLVALKSEISADGLSMHLALPMKVAQQARWDFDFEHETWAVMPAGGDALFTAAYLIGGELAARLANFGMLALIAALMVTAARRWLTLEQAFLTAALFASTPLVQLVTGSLFVENVWGAFILAAILALARYWESAESHELSIAGVLLGAALAVKLMAAVFLMPAVVLAGLASWRHKQVRPLAVAAILVAVLGAAPYLYAWSTTGNPIFPFANTLFKSKYFDRTTPFVDARFTTQFSLKTPYEATFRTSKYFEGDGGAAGFQYFLFLIPALLTLRRRFPWLLVAAGGSAALVLLIALPNLRYLYPALPLLSIAMGNLLAEWPVFATFAFVAITALNLWFLPSSGGWYHRDFTFFRHSDEQKYMVYASPVRAMVAHLNQSSPGEPVALFSGDAVAGLEGRAYTNTWHSEAYWSRVRGAQYPSEIAAILRELGIRNIVAPVSLESALPVVQDFLHQYAEPSGFVSGDLGLYRLRDQPELIHKTVPPIPPGEWDDLDDRIGYTGRWLHDRQFPESRGRSLTYSSDAGAAIGLQFTGSGITYIYTKALNRGRALVLIDGREVARLDMYSPEIQWQVRSEFANLSSGAHTFEVRVLKDKDPRSAGNAVDIDGIIVTN
jgi:Dolichyl-phosphate-mannose-protein mannosyltransferase